MDPQNPSLKRFHPLRQRLQYESSSLHYLDLGQNQSIEPASIPTAPPRNIPVGGSVQKFLECAQYLLILLSIHGLAPQFVTGQSSIQRECPCPPGRSRS